MRLTKLLLALSVLILLAGGAAAQPRDPLPVPDIPGFKTLKADLHMHTVFSDGDVWPLVRVEEAWRDGLDVISITDHIDYTPHQGHVSTDMTRPYALARDRAAGGGIVLVPGFEVSEGNLHFNVLFARDPNAFKDLPIRAALEQAREQGAFISWNHPGWKGTPEWFPLVKEVHDARLLDGMEIVNGRSFYPEAYPWIVEKSLTALANSDAHAPLAFQYAERTRPVTLLFAKTADLEGVKEALTAKRTAAWVNGEVWGQEAQLRELWSRAVEVENPEFTLSGRAPIALRLHNRSAIPFRCKVVNGPKWLRAGIRGAEPEKVTPAFLSAFEAAPDGTHKVEVKVELTNVHTGPGTNLVVTVPLTVTVQ